MNYIYLLIGLVVLYIAYEKFKPSNKQINNEIFYENNNLTENKINMGFVKPEHRLLKIFNNIIQLTES